LGSAKKEGKKTEIKELPKTKKPEDLMREVIPLSLSDKIRFTFDKNHKWSCEIVDEGRTQKR
jgi:hypothetical protein